MDKEEVLKKIKAGDISLEDVDKKYKADKEVVLIAVKSYGSDLKYADKTFQADKEIVLVAVKQDGYALGYADKKLQADKEVVLAAVKQDVSALAYTNTKLLADEEVIKVAFGVNFKTGEEGYKNFIKSEDLKGKKLTKVSVYLSKISERENAWGEYTFEDGSTKEGGAYLNNVLSGTIDFPNQDGEVTFKDFIDRLKDNEWTQYIDEFIDNFEGPGKSIDYDEDEFEDWSHHDTVDCDYDAKKDPSDIYFYFGDKKVTFNVRGAGTLYVHKNVAYTRENIAELIQEFEKN